MKFKAPARLSQIDVSHLVEQVREFAASRPRGRHVARVSVGAVPQVSAEVVRLVMAVTSAAAHRASVAAHRASVAAHRASVAAGRPLGLLGRGQPGMTGVAGIVQNAPSDAGGDRLTVLIVQSSPTAVSDRRRGAVTVVAARSDRTAGSVRTAGSDPGPPEAIVGSARSDRPEDKATVVSNRGAGKVKPRTNSVGVPVVHGRTGPLAVDRSRTGKTPSVSMSPGVPAAAG